MDHRNRVQKGIHRFKLNLVVIQCKGIAELYSTASADNRHDRMASREVLAAQSVALMLNAVTKTFECSGAVKSVTRGTAAGGLLHLGLRIGTPADAHHH